MDNATLHMLGYLTEEQWIDGIRTDEGNTKQIIICLAREVDSAYSTGWSDKLTNLLK